MKIVYGPTIKDCVFTEDTINVSVMHLSIVSKFTYTPVSVYSSGSHCKCCEMYFNGYIFVSETRWATNDVLFTSLCDK